MKKLLEAILKEDKVDQIIKDIRSGKDKYFSYGHFHSSNMADYDTMKYTIEDIVAVYGISEVEAADIIQALTHD